MTIRKVRSAWRKDQGRTLLIRTQRHLMILIPAVAVAIVVFQELLMILRMKYTKMMILMMMIRISQEGQQELDKSQNGWKTLYAVS